jgi:hypothetical protein
VSGLELAVEGEAMSGRGVTRTFHEPNRRVRRWLPAVLAIVLGAAVLNAVAQAQPPVATKPAGKEKTVVVNFVDKPWNEVLNWFAKESGLAFISTVKPTGTVTIKSDKAYTIPEVVDLLNEALARQNYVLTRRGQSFFIQPADEKTPDRIPIVGVEELAKRWNSEFVRVVFPLRTVMAHDIVPQVKKLLSPLGEVAPLGSNQIVVADRVGNLRNIEAFVKGQEDVREDCFAYQCKFVKAQRAADILRQLLNDQATDVQGKVPPPGNPRIVPRFRAVQIMVVEQTNTLLIIGPTDKLAVAKAALEKIDIGEPGDPPIPADSRPVLKTYTVAPGTAEAVARMLTEQYKNSPTTRIAPVPGGNQIMVYALPADHIYISKMCCPPAANANVITEFVPLKSADPARVAASLRLAFPPTTGLIVEARNDGVQIGVVLRGTPERIREARKYIEVAFGEGGGPPVTMPNGDPCGVVKVQPIESGCAVVGYQSCVVGRVARPQTARPVCLPRFPRLFRNRG